MYWDFAIQAKARVTRATVAMEKTQPTLPGQDRILVIEYATPPMADLMRTIGLFFMDTAGNAYINKPPLYVFIKGNKHPENLKPAPTKRLFKPAGLKVVFALLNHPEMVERPYRQIAATTAVALGTVDWIFRDLKEMGFLLEMGKRTSMVLDLMRQEKQKRVMELIHASLGSHDKRRCNEYLSLMYLMMLAGGTQEEINAGLESLNADFTGWLNALNTTSRETARKSNPIASALHTIFDAYAKALKLDEKARYSDDDRANYVSGFIERYQVEFQTSNAMEPLFAGRLFSALKRITKDFGLNFGFKDAGQFAKRLVNDQQLLADIGFNIERQFSSHGKTYQYRIGRHQ